MLQVGIQGQEGNETKFVHVKEMDLKKHILFETFDSEGEEYEKELLDFQGKQHDIVFEDIDKNPPWKLTWINPSDDIFRADVLLSFHHSLFGGTGGVVFHADLIAALNSSIQPHPSHILNFDNPPTLPLPQEQAVPFSASLSFVFSTIASAVLPFLSPTEHIWSGKPISFSLPYKTLLRSYDISNEKLSVLLKACKPHSVSITALIHVLVATSLSKLVGATKDPQEDFRADTPISVKPFLIPSEQKLSQLRVLLTTTDHVFSAQLLSSLANSKGDTQTELIFDTAARVKREMNEKLRSLPKNDIVFMLKYVTDWKSFWTKKDNTKRDSTWSLSNVGTLEAMGSASLLPDDKDDELKVFATRVIFTNGAGVAGAALGVNLGSVKGGDFTVTLSWQEGILDEEIVEAVGRDIVGYIDSFVESGKFL